MDTVRFGGISRRTAFAIQENPQVSTQATQDAQTGKWAGSISCIDANDRPRLLLSSAPSFDTEEIAVAMMDMVVEQVRIMPTMFGGGNGTSADSNGTGGGDNDSAISA